MLRPSGPAADEALDSDDEDSALEGAHSMPHRGKRQKQTLVGPPTPRELRLTPACVLTRRGSQRPDSPTQEAASHQVCSLVRLRDSSPARRTSQQVHWFPHPLPSASSAPV